MEFADDRYIQQIHKSGTISAAAGELGISQPALSMKLTQIEKTLGFRIFNRKTFPLSLTEAGKIYWDYLNKKNLLKSDCFRQISEITKAGECLLRIGAPTVYINSLLIDAASNLYKEHPNYKISIESGSFPELITLAETGSIDCFIATSEIADKNFTSIPIRQERTYLCIPEQHPLNQLIPNRDLTEQDLMKLNDTEMIFLQPNQPLQITLNAIIKKLHLKIQPAFTVNQISTALALTEKGLGLCFATGESIYILPDNSNICARSMHYIIPDRTIYVSYTKDRYMPAACINFINVLTKEGIKK